jgi:hypothetical protein
MMMGNLVEWRLAGETEVLGDNPPQRHFVHHKSHLTRLRDWTRAAAVGSQRLTAWAMARPFQQRFSYYNWSQNSSVSIATNQKTRRQRIQDSISGWGIDFSLSHSIKIGHPAIQENKAASTKLTTHRHLAQRLGMHGAMPPFPMCIHKLVLK